MSIKGQWLLNFWYKPQLVAYLFYPFHLLMYLLVSIRNSLYKLSILKSSKVSVPVIVVGNISVGGTGKSPLVIHLAAELSAQGYQVGVLSRGYGGHSNTYPCDVLTSCKSSVVGDEPLMIKQRLTNISVVVDPNRVRGAEHLIKNHHCDLIICDDGLQHYALQRDIELVVVDGQRNLGNRLLMPFGPLREPMGRLCKVDAVVINNPTAASVLPIDASLVFAMKLLPASFVSLEQPEDSSIKEISIDEMRIKSEADEMDIHAVAAIGNPERFFNSLDELGFKTINHSFSDHHQFQPEDFQNMQGLIIMTEKDAVKCQSFASKTMWYMKVDAVVKQSIVEHCQKKLTDILQAQR